MTSKYNESGLLDELTLGKTTAYESVYNPNLLQAVPRTLNRNELGLTQNLPFKGEDLWTGYEVSWLNLKGKPQVAVAEFYVPFDSPNLIESKSFKLYLNSFNQSRYKDWNSVAEAMTKDLSNCAGRPVTIKLFALDQYAEFQVTELSGTNIDELDIEIQDYEFSTDHLKLDKSNDEVEETLRSDLLKSNCLITNQPDWASIVIQYKGAKICQEGLLRYLISFRQHNEFHEQCVERVFCDINNLLKPKFLSVYARYTRRGGLDINPYRCSDDTPINRASRTVRQ